MSKQTTPYQRLLDNDATPRAFVVLGSFTILVGWMIAGVVIQGVQLAIHKDAEGTLSWFGLLGVNLTLITLIPLSVLVARGLNKQTPGLLSSVVGRLRWRPLAWFALISVVLELIAFAIIQIGDVPLATGERHGGGMAPDAIAIIAVTLLTSPIQAAGEEYFFRGYLLQAVGSFVRTSLVAVVVTGVLFTAAHGIWPWQSPALFVDRLAFGLIAGLLVVRTGGLEAGIASHAANNVVTFVFAAMTDTVGASLGVKDAPWPLVTIDVVKFAAFGAIAWWLSGRMKLAATSELPLTAVPVSGPGRV
ncbi:CPBP family intramembrane glutamic endopeptidase [Kribbella speibonae]|uniref:CPBP family intramembrane metalloprotease n=1 Tax=Kribbella speibonae TaxID=1572660 RepID=A0A4R0IN50_9ACTN|nr:type II CAAX endopeptidase family protein [Kribbella speibonae]TCC21994.1 CPBP family intramembrane metalloprotease [Kribbella speibonae]TCC34277.1 CPBP family intramembrane metalloprotease [Kribbella speibonae]